MRLGKLPFKPSPLDFKLTDVVDVAAVLPHAPPTFGHELGISQWGMLGNDRYGDCTCAGGCHEHMVFGHEVGRVVKFTDANALNLYTAVTGFQEHDPSTDQGAVVRDVLSYRRRRGVIDADYHIHKIDGYLSITPGNFDEVLAAAYVFGAVGIGFAFPDYAMDQFNAGKPWGYRAGKPQPTEGHYVPLVGHRSGNIDVITWGRRQQMTRAFFTHYTDECWAIYSREIMDAKGHTPEGFDRAALESMLAAL
jgi:hypothetical protein